MDRETIMVMAARLCHECVRNIAYFRGGWDGNKTKAKGDFWVTLQGNFIQIAILEWMKLFGSRSEDHHWRKIISESDQIFFKEKMLEFCQISIETLINTIKK